MGYPQKKEGLSVGEYQLLGEITSQAQNPVYQAQMLSKQSLEEWVAIKCCTDLKGQSASTFNFENNRYLTLKHPNLVSILDFGIENQIPFIVMEYVSGVNLSQLLKAIHNQKQFLPIPFVLFVMEQLCNALSYLHSVHIGNHKSWVHQHITPKKILIGFEPKIKLISFSLQSQSIHTEQTQKVCGEKATYQSPEQIEQPSVIDARSDIFSLGLVMWEMLTNRKVFQLNPEEPIGELKKRILGVDKSVPAPSVIKSRIPEEVDEIVLRAIQRDPEHRFSSAREMALALKVVLDAKYPEFIPLTIHSSIRDLFKTR